MQHGNGYLRRYPSWAYCMKIASEWIPRREPLEISNRKNRIDSTAVAITHYQHFFSFSFQWFEESGVGVCVCLLIFPSLPWLLLPWQWVHLRQIHLFCCMVPQGVAPSLPRVNGSVLFSGALFLTLSAASLPSLPPTHCPNYLRLLARKCKSGGVDYRNIAERLGGQVHVAYNFGPPHHCWLSMGEQD